MASELQSKNIHTIINTPQRLVRKRPVLGPKYDDVLIFNSTIRYANGTVRHPFQNTTGSINLYRTTATNTIKQLNPPFISSLKTVNVGNMFRSFCIVTGSMFFGIPLIAICQGIYLLSDFRKNHGSAPRPMMPSRGMVVVTNDDTDEDVHYYYYQSSTIDEVEKNESLVVLTQQSSIENHKHKHNETHHHSTGFREPITVDAKNCTSCSQQRRNSEIKKIQRDKPPLRLLVIGDSLAAGVGISGSSTPVLPESIAVALSKAMYGRPVYWACIGVPGHTASRIVQEIYDLDDNDNVSNQEQQPTEKDLMRRLQEWQFEMKNRAQERLDDSRRKASDWLEQHGTNINNIQPSRSTDSDDNEQPTTHNAVVQWCLGRRQELAQRANKMKDGIVAVIRPSNEITSLDKKQEQPIRIDDNSIVDNRRRVQRHPTLDPDVVGKYDIAVVLTGLNDLKEAYLPFMFNKQAKSPVPTTDGSAAHSRQQTPALRSEHEPKHDSVHPNPEHGLVGDLERITKALQDKMKDTVRPKVNIAKNQSSQMRLSSPSIGDGGTDSDERYPLVVFPALPVVPCPLIEWAPLCWFLKPLLQDIDRQKEKLASMLPGLVLYVDSPNFQEIWNAVQEKKVNQNEGASSLWNSAGERIHLKLTDVTQQAKERILEAMQKHYRIWADGSKKNDGTDHTNDTTDSKEKHEPYELDYFGDGMNTIATSSSASSRGDFVSSIVAVDGIHPNDEGYDIWGRHIASMILKEMQRRSRNGKD